MGNASQQSAVRHWRIAHHRWIDNVAGVACQRRGIAHPPPRVTVLLARHLVNSANGDSRCPMHSVFDMVLESAVSAHARSFRL